MAKSKWDHFSSKDQRIADLALALAHPARIAILRDLTRNGTLTSGKITKKVPIGPGTVAQHLAVLRGAGLIQGRLQAATTWHRINWKKLEAAQKALQALTAEWAKARASRP